MAEKHKSKYKKPENNKPTYRKDIKDYTMDDKAGGMNPKTTGEKQLNVLRKTDKEMQDDGKMYPTYKDDDRLYKDLEDGDYDPKTAAKRLKKRQDAEEKDVADVLKDKIENLTREQKERLVREYVRRKIEKILLEQPTTEEPPAEETPAEETPAEETPDAAPTDAAAAPTDAAPTGAAAAPTDLTTMPDAAVGAAGAAAGVAASSTETPATTTPAADSKTQQEPGPEERQTLSVSKIKDVLSAERSNLSRIETLFKGIDQTFEDADPIDIKNFYRLMLRTIAKKYKKIDQDQTSRSNKN
jgi:hypothetical protein